MRYLLAVAIATRVASAGPMRPLPVASDRPAAKGPHYVVDPKGDDSADGSDKKPWKTIAHAASKLQAGDTLYLRAGTYFESVTVTASGRADAPITIRAWPGELAIVDASPAAFETSPAKAWELVKGDEYRSTQTFTVDAKSEQNRDVWVTGNFADTMIPLHGYKFDVDLRADNVYWNVPKNNVAGNGVYLGPGVWFDHDDKRVHARLAHFGDYTGETDPRKLALVIGLDASALRLDGAKYVRVQDLVFRGSARHTVDVANGDHVELDHVTIYGGSPALMVKATSHFKLYASALRGLAAPWSSRASMKYRGASPYLFIADSSGAQSHDWEMAYNDFTDSHDGIVIDSVKTLRFHHNRLDNFNDDGIYLTLPPRKSAPEDVQIYENIITRTLTALSFAEPDDKSPNTVGPGVYIFRNVFDLRDPTLSWPAKDSGASPKPQLGRLCGDHGSPTWEPLLFYANTVVTADNAFRNDYGAGLAMRTKGSKMHVLDNIFVQVDGSPGLEVPRPDDDWQADGNLMWGTKSGEPHRGKLAKPGDHDVFADPRFVRFPDDLRLDGKSPAIDAGVAIPTDWPDTLRGKDKGKPDIGAIPAGGAMPKVGPAAAP